MKHTFSKLSVLLFCCFSLFLISGCEKTTNPAGGINELIYGYVNCEGNPIPEIKVISNYGYTFTDANGYFEILSYYYTETHNSTLSNSETINAHILTFTDIDSDKNGKYKEKNITVKAKTKKVTYVELEKE